MLCLTNDNSHAGNLRITTVNVIDETENELSMISNTDVGSLLGTQQTPGPDACGALVLGFRVYLAVGR